MKLHTQCVASQPLFNCMRGKLISLFDEISMASQPLFSCRPGKLLSLFDEISMASQPPFNCKPENCYVFLMKLHTQCVASQPLFSCRYELILSLLIKISIMLSITILFTGQFGCHIFFSQKDKSSKLKIKKKVQSNLI